MSTAVSIFLFVVPYLLGSIATAVWVSRVLYGTDIRMHGSGNAGSTNMFRVLGFKAGIFTQVVDVGKGCLAAALPYFVRWAFPETPHVISHWDIEMQSLLCGLLAVVGHIYPVFAGFKGGKGINTLLGMMLVANPAAAGIAVVVWIAVLYLTRFVAVASMVAVLSYPLFLLVRDGASAAPINWKLVALGFGMFLLVVFTHRTNIQRLIDGKESRNRWFEGKVKG